MSQNYKISISEHHKKSFADFDDQNDIDIDYLRASHVMEKSKLPKDKLQAV